MISEELMPIVWHPKRWCNLCVSEDEKKEIDRFWLNICKGVRWQYTRWGYWDIFSSKFIKILNYIKSLCVFFKHIFNYFDQKNQTSFHWKMFQYPQTKMCPRGQNVLILSYCILLSWKNLCWSVILIQVTHLQWIMFSQKKEYLPNLNIFTSYPISILLSHCCALSCSVKVLGLGVLKNLLPVSGKTSSTLLTQFQNI